VVGAQHALRDGRSALVEGPRLGQLALGPEQQGQVVEGRCGVGVVGPLHHLPNRESTLEEVPDGGQLTLVPEEPSQPAGRAPGGDACGRPSASTSIDTLATWSSQATPRSSMLRSAASSINVCVGPEEYAPRVPGSGRKAGSRCWRRRLVGVAAFPDVPELLRSPACRRPLEHLPKPRLPRPRRAGPAPPPARGRWPGASGPARRCTEARLAGPPCSRSSAPTPTAPASRSAPPDDRSAPPSGSAVSSPGRDPTPPAHAARRPDRAPAGGGWLGRRQP
jgi:hypothetical protein